MNERHGATGTKLHNIWRSMRARCYNPNNKGYKNYGGRGIVVCDEWRESFVPFREWAINSGYTEEHDGRNKKFTIERINVNGNYEPSNCRWATAKEQANNKSCNHIFEYNGEAHTLAEWSDIRNIPYHTLYKRLVKDGWSAEKALTKDFRTNRYITYNGETKTVAEWAKITGINRRTITSRIDKYHMPIESALEKKQTRHYITYMGETKTLSDWARTVGINIETLFSRINRDKMPINEALGDAICENRSHTKNKRGVK